MSIESMKSFVHTVARALQGRVKRNAAAMLAAVKRMPRQITWGRACTVLWLGTYAGLATASDTAPWESSLCSIADWFRGPTMIAVGSIAFGAAGAGFVFGEEFTGILKKVVNITMGICLAVGGSAILAWVAIKAGATQASCAVGTTV